MATEQVAETVAGSLEEAAQVARSIDWGRVNFGLGGLAVGLAFGFYVGYKFNRATIRAEERQLAAEEVDLIRKFYHDNYPKPTPEEVVEDRGYVQARTEEAPRPTKPPVPVQSPVPGVPVQAPAQEEWDYDKEIAGRSKTQPYVIHQNEFEEVFPEYQKLAWTYYAGDDILSDENDEVVVRPELVVGKENLYKFGHGSDDPNIVYIRNDRLELEWEITRSFKSHAVEVLGLDDEAEDGT